jgi:hypothetical protein
MIEDERVTAYLVIPMMSYYNDNWYEDYTLNWGAINPDKLFNDDSLAYQYMEQQTLTALHLDGVIADKITNCEQSGAYTTLKEADFEGRTNLLGLTPSPSLSQWLDLSSFREALPKQLSDAELLALSRLLDLRFFYIFETQMSATEFSAATSILNGTPERPEVEEEPICVAILNHPYLGPLASRPMLSTLSPDEAAIAARLERVTQLFGKRYATRMDYG